MAKTAFAIGAHPDDIEFMMAGTLVLLRDAGYEIHYMNVANGSCGTNQHDVKTIVRLRRDEAMCAAQLIGAVFHESLTNDIEVFYEKQLLSRMGAVIREVKPEIVLTHSPAEYMEDHSNTCRLVVTAAFCRGMTNFQTSPPVETTAQDVTVYHALPYGLRDPFGGLVQPGIFSDVSVHVETKREMLACHKSQKEWLDTSQGIDSYLNIMQDMCAEVGGMSGRFAYAEGWRRHLHLGFCDKKADPLVSALGNKAFVHPDYTKKLG